MRKYRKPRKEKTDLVERFKIAEERVEYLRINITKSEERVMALLDVLPYEYIFQYAYFDEWYFVIADFYLPKFRLMIEVDGESHSGAAQKRKEAKRKRWLKKDGIRVLRIRNKATLKLTSKQLKDRILNAVKKNNNKKC